MVKKLGLVLITGVFIALVFLAGCIPTATGDTSTPTDQGTASSVIPLVIFLVLIFGMFYLMILRPQRKRQQQQQQLMADLKKGDRVVTSGGIYGSIESMDTDTIVLKVESGALIRVARSSVLGKREPGPR